MAYPVPFSWFRLKIRCRKLKASPAWNRHEAGMAQSGKGFFYYNVVPLFPEHCIAKSGSFMHNTHKPWGLYYGMFNTIFYYPKSRVYCWILWFFLRNWLLRVLNKNHVKYILLAVWVSADWVNWDWLLISGLLWLVVIIKKREEESSTMYHTVYLYHIWCTIITGTVLKKVAWCTSRMITVCVLYCPTKVMKRNEEEGQPCKK